MARLRIFLFASVLCNLAVYGHGDVTTQKPVIILVPTSTRAVEVPSSSLNTSSETTSIAPEPAPTTKSEPPTSPAPTTTPPPTTTTPNTTTTPAPKPTPTPTPAPSPTPAPGPLPPPERGFWNYTEGNVTCILVQFAAQFNVTYTKDVNNSTLGYVLVNVPKNATVLRGSCNATGQWLQLGWPSVENTLTLYFQMNDTTKTYAVKSLNVSLAPELFVNSSLTGPVELWHGAEWSTPVATSYRCAAATRLAMSADKNIVANLTLSELQEEAFRTVHTHAFSSARDCGGGDLPDAVPIAVGCALGGLVVVVLVAYLLGRYRSTTRGYLSM